MGADKGLFTPTWVRIKEFICTYMGANKHFVCVGFIRTYMGAHKLNVYLHLVFQTNTNQYNKQTQIRTTNKYKGVQIRTTNKYKGIQLCTTSTFQRR
jgi:ribosomal protein S24E